MTIDYETLFKQHGASILGAVVVSLIGAVFLRVMMPEYLQLGLHVVMLLGGGVVGLLTPQGAVDHRGTNGIQYLLIVWLGYILFSPALFPPEPYLSDWLFKLMLSNIINGFTIILGIWVGAKGQPMLLEKQLPYLEYLSVDISRSPSLKKVENQWVAPMQQGSGWPGNPKK